MSGTTGVRRPKAAAAKGALQPAVPLAAKDALTVDLALFARDLEAGCLVGPVALGVLFNFAEAVRRGHVPHDEVLHWLADRFAAYLRGEQGMARLDVHLGLEPAKRARGKAGHDARRREAEAERTRQYAWRLAILEAAGFGERALVYVNDGVPGILPPLAPRAGRIESLEKLAPRWQRSDTYAQATRFFQEAQGRSGMLAKLRAYARNINRD
jgi:hypothetical protein